MRLDGKVALITDADGHFAKAIAIGYALEGAHLFLQVFPRSQAKLDELRKDVEASCQPDRRVAAGVYDITREAAVVEMTQAVIQDFGHIDILVNTAADGAHGVFFDLTEEQWDRALDTGLKSYFLTVKHVGKEMARRSSGKIINLTSIVGVLGSGGAVPWSAARGGVDAMTRAQAHALGLYGVHVNALARGHTKPDGTTNPETPGQNERLRRLPFGRLGLHTDVVGPAIFLATPDSDWVTGTVLYADGGYTVAAATDAEHRPGKSDAIHAPVPYVGP